MRTRFDGVPVLCLEAGEWSQHSDGEQKNDGGPHVRLHLEVRRQVDRQVSGRRQLKIKRGIVEGGLYRPVPPSRISTI
jgi:hypothetical protein